MININTFLKSLDNNNNVIVTPYQITSNLIKNATSVTAEQLIHKVTGKCENVVFNSDLGSYADPVLSSALSQYSLISAQSFITKNYDEKTYTNFISTYGLPSLILLHNNIEIYAEKLLQLYRDKTIYVLDRDKFCDLFLIFLEYIAEYTTVEWVHTKAYNPKKTKSEKVIATILAPVFVCDAIELHCLKTSFSFTRNSVQKLTYSSAYQTVNHFCDFYLNPSVHTLIPFLNLVLKEELITNKKAFLPLCNNIYDTYTNPRIKNDFLLPDELSFLKYVSLIEPGNIAGVINYLIYFSPLFVDFPPARKKVLENYLLNESEFSLEGRFEMFESIELISEIDTEWKFRHHVFITKDSSLSSYPVVSNELTEITLQD